MLPTMKMMTMMKTTPSTPSTMTNSWSASSGNSGTLHAKSQSVHEQPSPSRSKMAAVMSSFKIWKEHFSLMNVQYHYTSKNSTNFYHLFPNHCSSNLFEQQYTSRGQISSSKLDMIFFWKLLLRYEILGNYYSQAQVCYMEWDDFCEVPCHRLCSDLKIHN